MVFGLHSTGTHIYVNGTHVKSITEGKSRGRSEGGSGGRSRHHVRSDGRSAAIISASTFSGVLSNMRQQFVQVNRGGSEKLEGLLADTNNEFILLIVGREFVRVPIFQIRTVNLSRGSGGKNNNDDNQHSGGRQSGGRSGSGKRRNRSGGNRSGGDRTRGRS